MRFVCCWIVLSLALVHATSGDDLEQLRLAYYRLKPDGTLWAKIEGDDGTQEFEFQRIASP